MRKPLADGRLTATLPMAFGGRSAAAAKPGADREARAEQALEPGVTLPGVTEPEFVRPER